MPTDETSRSLTVIPAQLKSQLPIFQVLGDKLPAAAKSPEGKKTIASVIFWAIVAALAFLFVTNIDQITAFAGDMVSFASRTVLFAIFGVLLIVLLMLAPKIIRVLHRAGSVALFKTEREIVRGNPITALQMLLNDAKDTLRRVKDKITNVNAVRLEMIESGTQSQKGAEAKYTLVKRLVNEAGKNEEQAVQFGKEGNSTKANDLNRAAKEIRTKAFLLGKEGEAEEQNARSYAQYANQFAKVIEVLKDNESAARIYVSTLDSSISILQKKLEATQKMKSATEGLADVFNIKDGWVFQEAMGAATQAISQNIASIRSNLEFLDQNNNITVGGTPSQAELEDFVKKVDERNLKMLNVPMIGTAGYDMKESERIDKGFTLLD